MMTATLILAGVIIYFIIGGLVNGLFWHIICEHEENWCLASDCWCDHFFGFIAKLLAYTALLTWPIVILLIPASIYEFMRKVYANKL